LAFRKGIRNDRFQAEGKEEEDQERLKMKSRKERAERGRCLRRGKGIPSGPHATEEEEEARAS